MVRWVLYAIIITAMLFAPVEKLDAAKLIPVEALALSMEEGQVVLKTDMNNMGMGSTVEDAVADLKERSTGVVYLDTARYLLVAEEAEKYMPRIEAYMNVRVKKGTYLGGDVGEEAKYLDAHMEGEKPVSEK